MPEDAAQIAREAALEARAATTTIRSHIEECSRRYRETADTMSDIRRDVKTLLKQSARSEGRDERNDALFGGIPNVVWTVVIGGLWSAGLVAAAHYLGR